MEMSLERVSILGVRIDLVTLEEIISYTLNAIQNGEKSIIANVNVNALNIAYETSWFKDFINHSQIVFCDGFGVKWAARFLCGKNLNRYTPPDWFGNLANECASRNLTMFFLGTKQQIVERASRKLQENYPGLRILGAHHGFFDKDMLSSDNKKVINEINALKPDILVVGFGMPIQEKWIMENWDALNVKVVFPVGAFFDYLAGEVARAPRWMTDHGFEWLGRLLIEPRRLWKRYLIGNPVFIWRVLKQRFGLLSFEQG